MAKASADLRSLARSHTAKAVKVLVDVMRQPKSPPAARVMAATALLDRGWGRPPQVIAGDKENPLQMIISNEESEL